MKWILPLFFFRVINLPGLNPVDDPGNIGFKLLRSFTLQFNNRKIGIGRPCFVKYDLQNLDFIVFLYFLQRISSCKNVFLNNNQTNPRKLETYLFSNRSQSNVWSHRSTTTRSGHLSGYISQVCQSRIIPPWATIGSNSSNSCFFIPWDW